METVTPVPQRTSESVEKEDAVNHISRVPTPVEESRPQIVKLDSYQDDEHIDIGWRSWLVVFVTCFALVYLPLILVILLIWIRNGAQVFVVTAAGSVIAFIVRDLGDAPISGWVIQVCQATSFQRLN